MVNFQKPFFTDPSVSYPDKDHEIGMPTGTRVMGASDKDLMDKRSKLAPIRTMGDIIKALHLLGIQPNGNRINVYGGAGPQGLAGEGSAVSTIAALRLTTVARSHILVNGYYAAGDGGGGTYWWDSADSTLDDGAFHIAISGVATGRYRPIWEGRFNVRRGGAKGDNATDDKTPLQTCINAKIPLFSPAGTYIISTALVFDDYLDWEGSGITSTGAAFIRGAMATPLVHRNGVIVTLAAITGDENIGTGSSCIVRDIAFQNTMDAIDASCFQAYNMVCPVLFEACSFNFVYRGLELIQPFTSLVLNCKFNGLWPVSHPISEVDGSGNPTYIEAVGLYGFQSSAIGCDFQSCGTGARMLGPASSVRNSRFEVCGRGLQIGGRSQSSGTFGTTLGVSGGTFTDIQMEANEDNLRIVSMSQTTVRNIQGGSTINGPGSYDSSRGTTDGSGPGGYDGSGSYGVTIEGADHLSYVEGISMGGSFRQWAFRNYSGGCKVSKLNITNTGHHGSLIVDASPISVMTQYPYAGNPAFFGLRGGEVIDIHNRAASLLDASDKFGSYLPKVYLPGLVAPDYTKPPVYPRNSVGRIVVANGATTASYTFLVDQSVGNSQFNGTSSAAADLTSTVTAGDYYFASTVVGPRGENGIDFSTVVANAGYQKVTLTTLQKATMTFFGVDARLKRRIYVGRSLGNFLGYIEFTGTTFEYNGQALTGYGYPPENGTTTGSQLELDTNYDIIATPSWATTCYVSARLTTGFTLTFGTAAPSQQTIGWMLVRGSV